MFPNSLGKIMSKNERQISTQRVTSPANKGITYFTFIYHDTYLESK